MLSGLLCGRETRKRVHQVLKVKNKRPALHYLPLEETGVLHSAVWLVQLLVGVAHVFVPEPCFPLWWNIEQSSHLLLYRICKQRMSGAYFISFSAY